MPPKGRRMGVSEIPMPPVGEEFDDSSQGQPGADAAPAEPAAAPAPERPEIAELDFIEDRPDVLVPLAYPFKLDNRLVRHLAVRRLTLGAVRELTERARAEDGIDMVDLWAAMTGLPAPVIRGLKDEDGEKLADAAADFLPRAFRGAVQSA